MAARKKITEEDTEEKKKIEAKGCRLCRYRVALPQNFADPKSPRKPACCFGFEINDKVRPKTCELFTESDYYILHPEEP